MAGFRVCALISPQATHPKEECQGAETIEETTDEDKWCVGQGDFGFKGKSNG